MSNKHEFKEHNNIFKLTIDDIIYTQNVDKNIISCVIYYINPITKAIYKAKGIAKCHPNDKFDEIQGKRIAEGRAKRMMYQTYIRFIINIYDDILCKYEHLIYRETKHLGKLINNN